MQQVRQFFNRALGPQVMPSDLRTSLISEESALHVAAEALDVPLVHKLLEMGSDPRGANSKSKTSDEPIHAALRAYHHAPERAAQIISLLISFGALDTWHKLFAPGLFPPHVAVLSERSEEALAIMLNAGREQGYGEKLHRAIDAVELPKLCCEEGRIIALLALLEDGWDARSIDEHGATLVHHACNAPHLPESRVLAVVQVLIDHGNADLSRRDSFGRTVLQIARRRGMKSVCELLRQYGADEEAYSTLLLRGVIEVAPVSTSSTQSGPQSTRRSPDIPLDY